jgi:hypothetical protein
VAVGDDLPRFDEAVVEWMQEGAERHAPDTPLPADKIIEDLKNPFPKRKRTSLAATLEIDPPGRLSRRQ